jgi:hypothetical protein
MKRPQKVKSGACNAICGGKQSFASPSTPPHLPEPIDFRVLAIARFLVAARVDHALVFLSVPGRNHLGKRRGQMVVQPVGWKKRDERALYLELLKHAQTTLLWPTTSDGHCLPQIPGSTQIRVQNLWLRCVTGWRNRESINGCAQQREGPARTPNCHGHSLRASTCLLRRAGNPERNRVRQVVVKPIKFQDPTKEARAQEAKAADFDLARVVTAVAEGTFDA